MGGSKYANSPIFSRVFPPKNRIHVIVYAGETTAENCRAAFSHSDLWQLDVYTWQARQISPIQNAQAVIKKVLLN